MRRASPSQHRSGWILSFLGEDKLPSHTSRGVSATYCHFFNSAIALEYRNGPSSLDPLHNFS